MFASPTSRKPLSLIDGYLSTLDGSEKYRVIGNRAFFIDGTDVDISPDMDASYSAFSSSRENLRRILRSTVFSAIRSRDAEGAFSSFRQLTEGKFVLGVGGGPVRDFGSVNLNIGPWQNVEIIADAHRLPYRNDSVANISCLAVLEHLKRPDIAMEEMARVLTPGGHILVETPGLQAYHGFPNHFQNFTLTGHDLLIQRFGIVKVSSGASIGPTCAMVALISEYLRQYFPAGSLLGPAFKGTIGLLISQLDRLFANRANAFVLAGGSYFLGQKRAA
jgi:SAM-dependent methyltransferase